MISPQLKDCLELDRGNTMLHSKLKLKDKYDLRNIESETESNDDYRRVIFTGKYMQLVLMSLKPSEAIGEEQHDVDQFFRIESGKGFAVVDGKRIPLNDGDSLIVTAKTTHNIINDGKTDLKFYTLYSNPVHKDGIVEKQKLLNNSKDHAIRESINFKGLKIMIENPIGSVRKGIDGSGNPWQSKFYYDYGFIEGTLGADGDGIDVFVGNDLTSEKVFIVHQTNGYSKYDEDKAFVGFSSLQQARDAYLAHYNTQGYIGKIYEMPLYEFKEKIRIVNPTLDRK